jgi:hypothetical protein
MESDALWLLVFPSEGMAGWQGKKGIFHITFFISPHSRIHLRGGKSVPHRGSEWVNDAGFVPNGPTRYRDVVLTALPAGAGWK